MSTQILNSEKLTESFDSVRKIQDTVEAMHEQDCIARTNQIRSLEEEYTRLVSLGDLVIRATEVVTAMLNTLHKQQKQAEEFQATIDEKQALTDLVEDAIGKSTRQEKDDVGAPHPTAVGKASSASGSDQQ